MDRDRVEDLAFDWCELDELPRDETKPSRDFLAAVERARHEIEESFSRSLAKREDGKLRIHVKVTAEVE